MVFTWGNLPSIPCLQLLACLRDHGGGFVAQRRRCCDQRYLRLPVSSVWHRRTALFSNQFIWCNQLELLRITALDWDLIRVSPQLENQSQYWRMLSKSQWEAFVVLLTLPWWMKLSDTHIAMLQAHLLAHAACWWLFCCMIWSRSASPQALHRSKGKPQSLFGHERPLAALISLHVCVVKESSKKICVTASPSVRQSGLGPRRAQPAGRVGSSAFCTGKDPHVFFPFERGRQL